MGGTFDPIHIGHLILGESAYEQFGLDRVLFMPSGNPPHKTKRHGASNSERAEMVRLAIGNNPHFELSLEEMHEQGYIYTKETLRRLRMRNLCDQCVLVAAVRDQMAEKDLDEAIRSVRERFHADVRKLSSPNLDISSHTIRQWRSEGRSIRYYVTDPVVNYIYENGIYERL